MLFILAIEQSCSTFFSRVICEVWSISTNSDIERLTSLTVTTIRGSTLSITAFSGENVTSTVVFAVRGFVGKDAVGVEGGEGGGEG